MLGMVLARRSGLGNCESFLGIWIFSRTDIPRGIMVSCIEVQCGYETKENETVWFISLERKERHNYTFNEEHIYCSLDRKSVV